MNYEETALTYRNFGQEKKFQEKPDYTMYLKEKGWYGKTRSPRTGEYNQAEDLIKRESVPENWQPPHVDSEGNPVKYPIKFVNNIIRRRLADGSEWITSRQQWIALDSLGNAINISMDDKEMYDDVLPVYTQKPENPKDNPRFKDTKMISVIDRFERRIKYTVPFKPEIIQQLYDMRNNRNGNCTLTMIDESSSHPGVSIPKESFEAFKSGLFEEVWQWATIPRYKMEPSTTQENHKQYG